jgi:hypothetical protein
MYEKITKKNPSNKGGFNIPYAFYSRNFKKY